MEITAKMVKELREKTNAGMMDCKKALAECGGDMEKAKDWLREHGLATVSKRAGRTAKEGVIATSVSADGKRAAIVELNTETDFVAKVDSFRALAQSVALYLAGPVPVPASAQALLETVSPEAGRPFADLLNDATALTGEKSELRRVAVLEASGDSFVHAYNHAGDKLAVLAQLTVEKPGPAADEAAHALAMQIAAAAPLVVNASELNPADVEREKKIYLEQLRQENEELAKEGKKGKPEAMWPKIVEGKLKKIYYEQVVLSEQKYIREPELTVAQWLQSLKDSLGKVTIQKFVRFQLAEELVGEDAGEKS
ncbi:MAG: translation elongation factor Ts [Deltaproteobacteria bacterium]|jgi:elongation factor Ts|nr:translation elongation factor Ts [Deltaproteobacteria bacterium]